MRREEAYKNVESLRTQNTNLMHGGRRRSTSVISHRSTQRFSPASKSMRHKAKTKSISCPVPAQMFTATTVFILAHTTCAAVTNMHGCHTTAREVFFLKTQVFICLAWVDFLQGEKGAIPHQIHKRKRTAQPPMHLSHEQASKRVYRLKVFTSDDNEAKLWS